MSLYIVDINYIILFPERSRGFSYFVDLLLCSTEFRFTDRIQNKHESEKFPSTHAFYAMAYIVLIINKSLSLFNFCTANPLTIKKVGSNFRKMKGSYCCSYIKTRKTSQTMKIYLQHTRTTILKHTSSSKQFNSRLRKLLSVHLLELWVDDIEHSGDHGFTCRFCSSWRTASKSVSCNGKYL